MEALGAVGSNPGSSVGLCGAGRQRGAPLSFLPGQSRVLGTAGAFPLCLWCARVGLDPGR